MVLTRKKELSFVLAAMLAGACSKDVNKKDDSENKETESAAVPQCDAGIPNEECSQTTAALVAGLPEFCSTSEYNGKSCVKCVPREIPILRCGAGLSPQFSASDHCTYDASAFDCSDPASGISIIFDYSKKTLKEKYYENLPQVVGGVKFVVSATMKEEAEDDRILLFGLLDRIALNRKALFSGENTDKLIADVLSLYLEKNPNLSEAKQATIKEYVQKILAVFSSNLDQDVVTTDDFISMFKSVVETMKIGDDDALTGKINVEKMESLFQSTKTREMIDELLKGLAAQ